MLRRDRRFYRFAFAADLHLGGKQRQFVRQSVAQEALCHLCPTLDHQAHNAARTQIVEQFGQRGPAFEQFAGQEFTAQPGCLLMCFQTGRPDKNGRVLPGGLYEFRRERHSAGGIEHDANRRTGFQSR